MMRTPRAGVVVFPGSNGDRDLFEALHAAGFLPTYLRSDEDLPDGVELVTLPGGFSYGDAWRAGMLASQERAVKGLPALLARGGMVLGVCNGFQILVEAGLLPGALTYNQPPGFLHGFTEVMVTECAQVLSGSPWFSGLEPGTRLRLPIAHGEGNYVHPGGPLAVFHRVPLVYVKNPNGSMGNTAALLDETGRMMGIMPHPERAIDPLLGSADGLLLLRAAQRFLAAA